MESTSITSAPAIAVVIDSAPDAPATSGSYTVVGSQSCPAVESPCIDPGTTVLLDGDGDATTGSPENDVTKLSIAEPQSLGPDKIMFVMKVTDLVKLPPSTTWATLFHNPNVPSDRGHYTPFFVRMATDAMGNVSFTSGVPLEK